MYIEHLRLVTVLLEPNPEEARRLSDADGDIMVAAVRRQLPSPRPVATSFASNS